MRVPPRGERYVAANWVVVVVAVGIVVVGSTMVLSVRDQLPDEVVLHWSGGQPSILVGLWSMLVIACSTTLGAPALILVSGRLAAGSWRHTWSSAALVATLGLGLSLYGVAWWQRHGPPEEPEGWLLNAWVLAALAGNVLRAWVRPTLPRKKTDAIKAEPGPPMMRLAWVGTARVRWSTRIGSTVGVAFWVVFLAWWTDTWAMLLVMGGICVVLIAALTRTREVAVDYSGVGVRGGIWTPSAIKMTDIRSVGVGHVSALRDFGGWGHKVAADGTEGWISRSGEALLVHRRNQPDFVFTVDDAAGAAAVLETFLTPSEVA